ncbi:uncharacterized protein K452DRAFT_39311 [Aplosporella prunicola CBS 121167]|uniref:Uncharacterized protein n=1 Tax=Aplosporella prunicola CBS 121167 TaxID=1176127 RepID=A0A6A6BDV4_9PEZI|nr:uncharacterized protein K452DRAFT_39311 [Aplosporella prunicola CBS 121167]KAF2141424.1 hypothetical protein K452DRAFT_39311 [Aplosporella prunicola CBS 121167]
MCASAFCFFGFALLCFPLCSSDDKQQQQQQQQQQKRFTYHDYQTPPHKNHNQANTQLLRRPPSPNFRLLRIFQGLFFSAYNQPRFPQFPVFQASKARNQKRPPNHLLTISPSFFFIRLLSSRRAHYTHTYAHGYTTHTIRRSRLKKNLGRTGPERNGTERKLARISFFLCGWRPGLARCCLIDPKQLQLQLQRAEVAGRAGNVIFVIIGDGPAIDSNSNEQTRPRACGLQRSLGLFRRGCCRCIALHCIAALFVFLLLLPFLFLPSNIRTLLVWPFSSLFLFPRRHFLIFSCL